MWWRMSSAVGVRPQLDFSPIVCGCPEMALCSIVRLWRSTLTAYVSAANLFVGCYHVMCRHLPMLAG